MGEQRKITNRGIPAARMRVWTDCFEKEDRLRLKWFRRNEERLVAYAGKPSTRTVPQEVLDQVAKDRKEQYRGVEKYPLSKGQERPPPLVDLDAIYNTMKPVDPETRKLLYTGMMKDGRFNYLDKRMRTIPEDKYYFPETTSFGYGWKMWNSSSTATPVRYGKIQVIKSSFYRRTGVGKDPDWYQEPEKLSPSVCDRS